MATPIFARRYNQSCTSCHTPAYPRLNGFGRQVKEAGYQLPLGAEEPAREKASLSPGSPNERLAVFGQVPLSVRGLGGLIFPFEPEASQQSLPELRAVESVQLQAGGSIYKNVSFFGAAELAPNPTIHHAAVGVHNLGAEGLLNVRAGQLLLLDFSRPEHREISVVGDPVGTVRVGNNPNSLDSTQLGVQAFGRVSSQRLFWNAAVIQGAQAPGSLADLDRFKDLFGQLQWTGDFGHVGALGYWGNTQVVDLARGTAVRFTDRFWRAGLDAELDLGTVSLFGQAIYGRHSNPTGQRSAVDYLGLRAELLASLREDLYALIRIDAVGSDTDASLDKQYLTTHLGWLALTNLRVWVDYVAPLHALNQSAIHLRMDVAL